MSDITLINDSEQSSLVTNGLAKNGEMYLKKAGSTDAGAIFVYDSGAWKTFANEYSAGFSNTYSVDFDGTDEYVETGEKFDFIQTTGNFTISAWIKFTAHTSTSNIQSILGTTYTSSQKGFYLFYDNRSSNKTLRVSLPWGSTASINVNNGITDNNWHHLVVTGASGGNITLYKDGSQIGTASAPSTTSTSGLFSMKIGTVIISGAATNSLNGKVDEVSMFNSTLSSSDITSIYNSGVPNDISSLSPVSWWRMGDNDNGTGTTVTDQGSGGNNGTLTNGPTFSTDIPS